MNRIKLIACPYCRAAVGEDCHRADGSRRHNPITRKVMFHRWRIEQAVREVGLVEPKPQPKQLAAYQGKAFDFAAAAELAAQKGAL